MTTKHSSSAAISGILRQAEELFTVKALKLVEELVQNKERKYELEFAKLAKELEDKILALDMIEGEEFHVKIAKKAAIVRVQALLYLLDNALLSRKLKSGETAKQEPVHPVSATKLAPDTSKELHNGTNEAAIDEVLVTKLFDAADYEQSKMETFLLSRGGVHLNPFMKCVVTFWSSNLEHQQRVRQRILKLLSSSPKLAASFDSPTVQKELLKLISYSIHAATFRQECSPALELMVSNEAFLSILDKGNFLQVLSSKLNDTDSIMSFLLFCCGARPAKLESNGRTGKEDPSPEFVKQLVTVAQKNLVIEGLLAELESNRTTTNLDRIGQFLLTALSGDTSSPLVPHILKLLRLHKKAWSTVVTFTLGGVKSNPKSEEQSKLWTQILTLYIAQSKDFDFEKLEEIFNNIERCPNAVLLHLLDLAALLCTMKGVCNKLKMQRILVNTFKLLSIPRNEAVSAKLVTIFTAAASRPKIDLLEHVLHDCQLLYYFAESCKRYKAKSSIVHKDYNPIFVEIGVRFIFLARLSEKFEKTCEASNDWKFIEHSDLFKLILRTVQQLDKASKETNTFDRTSMCPRNYVIKVFEYEDGNDSSTTPHSPKISAFSPQADQIHARPRVVEMMHRLPVQFETSNDEGSSEDYDSKEFLCPVVGDFDL